MVIVAIEKNPHPVPLQIIKKIVGFRSCLSERHKLLKKPMATSRGILGFHGNMVGKSCHKLKGCEQIWSIGDSLESRHADQSTVPGTKKTLIACMGLSLLSSTLNVQFQLSNTKHSWHIQSFYFITLNLLVLDTAVAKPCEYLRSGVLNPTHKRPLAISHKNDTT